MTILKLRGRVRHEDRFGLSYWLWQNTRAMGTTGDQPRTDDTGVLEQLRRLYKVLGEPDRGIVSVDVGAYIGVISLAMARFGPSNHAVHSFEADDLNYDRLTQNVSGAVGAPIHAHNTAVGNQVGTAEFTRNHDPGTNHLGVESESSFAAAAVYTVPVTTLDEFTGAQKLDEIDVVKVDVEGADLDVLRGASGLLSGGRIKAILVEIPLTPEKRDEMTAFIAGHGYSIAYIVRDTTDLVQASEAAYMNSARKPLNLLALRTDVSDRINLLP